MQQNDSQTDQFGTIPKDAEAFGNMPNASESFGTIRKDSESFRTMRNVAERKENHTMTTRDAARLFEAAGVARTERSIVNWCQPNPQGISRLDAYFDPNDRKWLITPQSVERAIAEEKAKVVRTAESMIESVRKDAERGEDRAKQSPESEPETVKKFQQEILDLKITNRGKDFFIEQLQKERDGLIHQIVGFSHKVGELETKLLQLESPASNEPVRLKVASENRKESFGNNMSSH